MKILKIHDDKPTKGCCTLDCEFTEEEVDFFIEYAVNDILKKQIERMSRTCCDCEEVIDEDTIEKYPNTEICGDCLAGE